jgi:hypothetical protein
MIKQDPMVQEVKRINNMIEAEANKSEIKFPVFYDKDTKSFLDGDKKVLCKADNVSEEFIKLVEVVNSIPLEVGALMGLIMFHGADMSKLERFTTEKCLNIFMSNPTIAKEVFEINKMFLESAEK